MPGFEEFRDTLQGVIPMPISGFICHKGQLSAEQLHDLAEVLALNVAKGGFRLEGTCFVDTYRYQRALDRVEGPVGIMIAEPSLVGLVQAASWETQGQRSLQRHCSITRKSSL